MLQVNATFCQDTLEKINVFHTDLLVEAKLELTKANKLDRTFDESSISDFDRFASGKRSHLKQFSANTSNVY